MTVTVAPKVIRISVITREERIRINAILTTVVVIVVVTDVRRAIIIRIYRSFRNRIGQVEPSTGNRLPF